MTPIDGHDVSTVDLDVEGPLVPFVEMDLTEFDEGPGKGAPQATKQLKFTRRRTPQSNSLTSSPSSRLRGLGHGLRVGAKADHRVNLRQDLGRSRCLPKSGYVKNEDHKDLCKEHLPKYRAKAQSPYLISPPASRGSSLVSTASDARSEISIAQFPASPPSNNDIEQDGSNGDFYGLMQIPDPECPRYVSLSYPQTIQLPESPQSNPKPPSEPQFSLCMDFVMAGNGCINHNSIASQEKHHVTEGNLVDMFQSEKCDPDVVDYEGDSDLANQVGQPGSPMIGSPMASPFTIEPAHFSRQDAEGLFTWVPGEWPDYSLKSLEVPMVTRGWKYFEEEIPGAIKTTFQIESDGVSSVVQVDSEASFHMYVEKGNFGSGDNWRSHVPNSLDQEPEDPQSPSQANLMTIAEEELEERVSRALYYDESLASILKSKLKHKLSHILPLFVDEQALPFEFFQRNSYNGYERGTPRTSTPNSSSNSDPSVSSKSINTATAATPATTVDTGAREEDEDVQRPGKRQRRQIPPDAFDQRYKRRQLRCHFHAKSPSTHQRKTCMISGWPSIHRLDDHYKTNHTQIRCNKCFLKFDSKPPKNAHQKTCNMDAPAPLLDVIDCDKTDEIKEAFKALRRWRLDIEVDVDMKSWIVKYKSEPANDEVPLEDEDRELAKWYIMWRLLFPDRDGQVPSPFHNTSLLPEEQRLESMLEVFQSTVEANVQNNQRPPSDLSQQIEYYKDAIRTVFQLLQSSPNSTPMASTVRRIPSDERSIPTIAGPSVHSSSNRHDIDPTRLNHELLGEASPEDPDFHNDSALFQPVDFAYSSSPSIFSPNSGMAPPESLGSPCAAETRGAVGESPIIRLQEQEIRMPHTNTASNYRATIGTRGRTPSTSQMPMFTPAQGRVESALALQSGLKRRSMQPPPFIPQRGQSRPSVARRQTPQLQVASQPHYPQLYRQQLAQSPAGSYMSPLAGRDASTALSLPNGELYQGDQSWDDGEMGLYGSPDCMHCFDTGFISTGAGCSSSVLAGYGLVCQVSGFVLSLGPCALI